MSRSRPSRPVGVLLLLVALLVLLVGAPAGPADAAAPEGVPTGPETVQGVVRGTDGAPIADATVTLGLGVRDPATAGPGGSGSWEGRQRTATTDASGRYRFAGVPTPGDDVDVWSLGASKDGFATDGTYDVGQHLRTAPGTPADSDFVLRRLDVTLRGRVSVRGGTPDGGWVTVTPASADPNRSTFDSWYAWPDGDGRWELRVPAGAYRVSAQSTYGLRTSWPDLPSARPAPATREVAPGGVLDGLDVSMRLRQPGPAVDEYGEQHAGWDQARWNDPLGRYPRDTYRSVTAVRGAELALGTPTHGRNFYPLPRLPAGELLTLTGTGIPIDVPVQNTGDDVLFVDGARLEGAIGGASRCYWQGYADCAEPRAVMPGETQTIQVTPMTDAYAPEYALDLVLATSVGSERRVPLRLRNVGKPEYGADDYRNMAGIAPYLSDEDRWRYSGFLGGGEPSAELTAFMAALTQAATPPAAAPAPAAARRPTPPGVLTLARSSVRFTFPGAGRVDVRIDRLVRAKRKRQPDRWALARTVALKATRPGARSVRIKRLAVGPYRVRIVARVGGKVRRVTDYRDVRP